MKNDLKVLINNGEFCKELLLGEINVFYGANNAGKSKLLNIINEGFNGKLKDEFIINGFNVSKNDYEVVYIEDRANFSEQLKLGSKSLLKKIIMERITEEIQNEDLVNRINSSINLEIEGINKDISEMLSNYNKILSLSSLNIRLNLNTKNLDNLLLSLIDIVFEDGSDILSAGALKELLILFYIVYSDCAKDTLLIIDSFDSYFNIETTIKVLKLLKSYAREKKIRVILSSYNGVSYKYIYEDAYVYIVKKDKISRLPNINSMIRKAIIYAEYVKNTNLNDFDGYSDEYKVLITDDEIEFYKSKYLCGLLDKIGILMTNNKCELTIDGGQKSIINEGLVILASDIIEYNILRYVKELLC